MGAADFTCTASAPTAKEAFRVAVDDALYEHGHGGYTGTIAEKSSYTEMLKPGGVDVDTFLGWAWDAEAGEPLDDVPQHYRRAVDRAGRILGDKWGPALCIKVEPGKYLFAGFASC